MEFTGERFVPQCEGEIAAEHYHRYFFAARLVAGMEVLDAASGEGYGTHILSRHARHATGLDISREAFEHASRTYGDERTAFLLGSATDIPLPDAVMDAVVSFETLEHLEDQEKMLAEMARVLKTNGILIISSPNRPVYKRKIDNEWHLRELDMAEFAALLHRHFRNVRLFSQRMEYASFIAGAGPGSLRLSLLPGNANVITRDVLDEAMYYIALASNAPLPLVPSSLLAYPEDQCFTAIELRKCLAGNESRLHALEMELADRRRDMDELQRKLQTAREENTRSMARAEEYQSAFRELVNSRSWRLTEPLRAMKRCLGAFRPKSKA